MAEDTNSGKDEREPRPSYTAVNAQLTRLARSLQKIDADQADENGALGPVQAAQVKAAIVAMAVARTALGCIQDQAPYNMKKE